MVHFTPNESPISPSRGIFLGAREKEWIWSGYERSALIIGPTRSGKTSSIIVPNVLCAPRAVVSTSTKKDVMESTSNSRKNVGYCVLFDPTGETSPSKGVERIGWSPLRAARQWDGALDISSAMVSASQRRASGAAGIDHWSERAGALLAPLVYAAHHAQLDMATVVGWIDRRRGEPALEILESVAGDDHPSTSLLSGILASDSRELSSIWSTTSGVVGAYRSLGALNATRETLLDADLFVEHPNTLYICAPGRKQTLLAPLVVGLLSEIQSAGYRRNTPEQPLLFALDELANIAPLPDLPQLVSEGGGQGVLTIGCLQDLSQARARWGSEADGLLSLFSTTLLLGGVADMKTLRSISELAGEHTVIRQSESLSRDAKGLRTQSRSLSPQRENRLGIDEIAHGRANHGIVLDATKRLGWIRLSQAHRDEPWRSLVGGRTIKRAARSFEGVVRE